MRNLLLSCAALAACLAAAPLASAQTIAITGGKVVTNTGQGVLERGTVVIANGRVVSVGTGSAPSGATVIDATGKWVTPGLFAAFSQIGLAEIDAEDDANDINQGGSDFQISTRIADSYNPADTGVAITRIEGITRMALAGRASGGLFGGYGGLVDTSGSPGVLPTREAFVVADLGDRGASLAGGSRAAMWAWLEAAIADARAYPGRYADGGEGDVLSRREAAALAPVVAGRVPVLVNAQRSSDILAIIALKARQPAMKFIIVGAAEGWMVANQLAAAGIPVIVNPQGNLPDSFEQLGATMENAGRLAAAGVQVAIGDPGESAQNARLIPQLAGNAVANGMPWQAAFEAISSTPAKIYGRTDLGVLSPGATADVVIWDGDPLELMSSPDAVYIAGQAQPMTSRQTELRDRYITPPDARPHAYRYGQ